MNSRLSSIQKKIQPQQAILLSAPKDIAYFCDFHFLVPEEREALMLISAKNVHLMHMHFSPIPKNIQGITTHTGCSLSFLLKHINTIQKNEKLNSLLIDQSSLHVNEYLEIKKAKKLSVKKLDKQLIWEHRTIKTEDEIKNITKACNITVTALAKSKKIMDVGITEKELAHDIEKNMRANQNTKIAFPIIVAFGKNTALPHHQPSNKKLENNMAVLIDIGAAYYDYCADMTRSFWFGDTPDLEFIKIQATVNKAYEIALAKLNTSFVTKELTLLDNNHSKNKNNPQYPLQKITAKDIDNEARDYIVNTGYGEYFIHTTGHGLGLDIHEPPSLSWRNKQQLKPGMTITIEPGIYLPNKFGYRYENTVSLM